MSFLDHLEELRRRLFICFIALAVGMTVSFAFSKRLFAILADPLRASMPDASVGIIFTGVAEAFQTYMWISLAAGVILASPVLFHHFWSFVAPGLYKREKRILAGIVAVSTFLLLAGITFAYLVVLPFILQFFLSFATPQLTAAPRMGEYLSFVAWFVLIFGLTFQLPLIMTLLSWLGILAPETITSNRSIAVVAIFIVSAVVTPPDVISMLLLAGPLLILFELGILASKYVYRRHNI